MIRKKEYKIIPYNFKEIKYNINQNEYYVEFNDMDMIFETENQAKKFIDNINNKKREFEQKITQKNNYRMKRYKLI